MSWTRDFRAGHVSVNLVGMGAAEVIHGVTSMSIRANSEIQKETSSGSVYADTIHLQTVRPVATFSTFDLPQAIDTLGLLGKCIIADGTHPGISLFGQKQTCAGVASGSVHDEYLIKAGIVVPRTLSVDHRGNAQLTYEIYAAYDGTNAPVLRNASVALPTYASVGRWTMHDLRFDNAAPLEGKRNISIDFNPGILQEGADSEQYESVVSLSSLMPRVTVTGVDTSWFTTVAGILGDQVSHATTFVRLRKRDVDIATAEHVVINFNGLVTWDTLFDGNSDSPATCSLACDVNYDGTNAPIAAQTAQSLS